MGACGSSEGATVETEEGRRSRSIDKALREDEKRMAREVKVHPSYGARDRFYVAATERRAVHRCCYWVRMHYNPGTLAEPGLTTSCRPQLIRQKYHSSTERGQSSLPLNVADTPSVHRSR